MRVLVVTLFTRTSGSSRVMAFQFLPLLREQGVDTDVITVYPDEFFNVQMGLVPTGRLAKQLNFGAYLVRGMVMRVRAALAARRYDAVYVQRDAFPRTLLRLLKAGNPNLVYEFEDTFADTNPFLEERGLLYRALLHWQLRLYRNMVAEARHVIAVNQEVAAEAATVNPNVTVMCEPLDLSRYRDLPPRPATDQLVIGWIGSPSTTRFLHPVAAPLRRLCERYPNLVVRLVGAAADLELPGVRLDRRAWSVDTEIADLVSFDIGICPLHEDPFYQKHLSHKMIQYMAVGIPIVAQRCAVNASVVTDGVNGFLCDGDDEWTARLAQLLGDGDLRRRLGSGSHAIAEERFALDKQATILGDILRAVAR
ncbi:MAG TPA: glycosyltransferase family 4 protein [Kofleriaceae bacterium]|nr:glycosyltransferase family 4 protein [Kofleriaceae bacterium]